MIQRKCVILFTICKRFKKVQNVPRKYNKFEKESRKFKGSKRFIKGIKVWLDNFIGFIALKGSVERPPLPKYCFLYISVRLNWVQIFLCQQNLNGRGIFTLVNIFIEPIVDILLTLHIYVAHTDTVSLVYYIFTIVILV